MQVHHQACALLETLPPQLTKPMRVTQSKTPAVKAQS
jgi:hypothetical protein